MTAQGSEPEPTTVFFSYSRQDQAQAIPIINAIKDAGYSLWWDGMLEGGTTFLESTEAALESAHAVVVLWSETSIQSHWVRDEATSGRVRNRLIPLSLDGSEPPLGFRQIQVIDFSSWKPGKQSPAYEQLIFSLSKLHDMPAPEPSPPQPAKTSNRRIRPLLIGITGLMLALFAAFLYLRPAANPPITADKNSVAVLPFQNLSNDPEMDYLANGLSSELRLALARNQSLKVAAKSSSSSVAAQNLSAKEIAAALSVSKIIDGTLEKQNDTIRISTELIDGNTGFASSVKSFEHDVSDALLIRNEIAGSLAELLTVEVSSPGNLTEPGGTQNAAAFNEYLKGYDLFLANKGPDGARTALTHINRAIEFDPDFGLAYAVKARIFLYLGGTASSVEQVKVYFGQSLETAQKAVEISPNSADAQSTLGQVFFVTKLDINSAKRSFAKSLELGSGNQVVLARASPFYVSIGDFDKADETLNRALELDPLNLTLSRILGNRYYYSGNFTSATKIFEDTLKINPDYRGIYKGLAFTHYFQKQNELALEMCKLEKDSYDHLTCLAIISFEIGDHEKAKDAFNQLDNAFGEAATYQKAQIYVQWGEKEKALDALELAFQLRDPGLTDIIVDPMLNPLRDNPRFTIFLEKIGFIE